MKFHHYDYFNFYHSLYSHNTERMKTKKKLGMPDNHFEPLSPIDVNINCNNSFLKHIDKYNLI